jgi:hypothetical protein
MTIGDTTYAITNVEKAGHCFLHYLDNVVDPEAVKG